MRSKRAPGGPVSTGPSVATSGRRSSAARTSSACARVRDEDGVRHVRAGREGTRHQLLPARRALLVAELVAGREVRVEVDEAERHHDEDRDRADPHPPRVPADALGDPAPDAVRRVGSLAAVARDERPERAAADRSRAAPAAACTSRASRARSPIAPIRARPAVPLTSASDRQSRPAITVAGRGDDRRAGRPHRGRDRDVLVLLASQLLAVAGHDQQRVVGAGAEDEHGQDRRGLAGDRDAELGEQVAEPARAAPRRRSPRRTGSARRSGCGRSGSAGRRRAAPSPASSVPLIDSNTSIASAAKPAAPGDLDLEPGRRAAHGLAHAVDVAGDDVALAGAS